MVLKIGKITLMELCADFEITVQDSSHKQKYIRTRRIKLLRKNIKLTKKDFIEAAAKLAEAYPDKGYKFRKYKGLWILSREKGVPLYYSRKTRKIYVPKTWVERRFKEVKKALPYRLKSLNIPFRLETL